MGSPGAHNAATNLAPLLGETSSCHVAWDAPRGVASPWRLRQRPVRVGQYDAASLCEGRDTHRRVPHPGGAVFSGSTKIRVYKIGV